MDNKERIENALKRHQKKDFKTKRDRERQDRYSDIPARFYSKIFKVK